MKNEKNLDYLDYNFYNEDVIGEILHILKDFLYHIESHRCINNKLDDLQGEREFWIYTSNAHIMNAAISWCKVFGTYSNKTHWNNIFDKKIIKYAKAKFFALLEQKNISKKQYEENREKIRSFRDKYVAHNEDYEAPIPNFDYACKTVFCLDELLREGPYLFHSKVFSELTIEYRNDIMKTLNMITK